MSNNNDDLSARLRRSLDARGLAPELSPDLVSGASDRTAPRLANPARRLQVAGGATVLVAAVAVGALVISPTFRQQEPLFTSAGGASPAGAMSAEDSTSKMIAGAWITYEYVPGAGLSTNGGSGSVYELKRTGKAQDRLDAIADAFGVEGSPAKSSYFDEAYPSYVVGPEDGTGPSVSITWSGTGDWYYNDPTANPAPDCEPIPIEGDGGIGSSTDPVDPELVDPNIAVGEPYCEYVEPKLEDSLAPSEAEARKLAKAIFAETGLDVAAGDIRVTVDAWQTTATTNLVVDGTKTALEWTVSWAPTGDISWAYGHSISVVDRGSFGTVSPADAVERLADWRWYGQAGPEFQGGMNILAMDSARGAETKATETDPADPDAPVSNEPEVPSTEPSTEPSTDPGTEPQPEPSVDPEPTIEPEPTVEPEPLPEPENVVVTVDSAEATLLLMWDSAGNAWLVPGFAVQHPDGWYNTVASLVEGVIELPAPIEVEPYLEDDVRLED